MLKFQLRPCPRFPKSKPDFPPRVLILSAQEPLPPPREELQIDTTTGDAELFVQYFCPTGIPHPRFLGDLWLDAPWKNVCHEIHGQV